MSALILFSYMLAQPILGLAILIAWMLGWLQTALWLYVFGVAIFSMANALEYRRLDRDLSISRKHMITSVDLSLYADIYRFSDTKGRLKVLSLFIGEAGVWPFMSVLNALAHVALSTIVKVPESGRFRVQYQLSFRFPPTLMLFAGYLLQTAFLIICFDDSVRGSVSFKITSAVNIGLFIVFSLHLFASDNFSKNFSRSAINPRIFMILTIAFAVTSAILIRLDFIAAFLDPALEAGRQSMFDAFRSITVDLKVFDLFAILKQSNDFDTFLSDTYAALASMTPLQVLDLYLGTALVTNFLRLFKSIHGFKYEDEDHSKRAMAFLDAGQIQKARRVLANISKDGKTLERQGQILAAIAENDIAEFVRLAKNIGKDSEFATLGQSGWATEYLAMSKAFEVIPLDDVTVFEQLDAYWKRHANPCAILALYRIFAAHHMNNFIKNSISQNQYADYSFAEVIKDTQNLLKQFHEDELKPPAGSEFIATIGKKYREGQLAFALLSVLLLLEHRFSGQLPHEAEPQVRCFADEVFEHVYRLMMTSGTVEPISFGVLPRFNTMAHFYEHFYCETNQSLSGIIKFIGEKRREAGLEAQQLPAKLS